METKQIRIYKRTTITQSIVVDASSIAEARYNNNRGHYDPVWGDEEACCADLEDEITYAYVPQKSTKEPFNEKEA